MNASGFGLLLLRENGRFSCTITDGDLRRLILQGASMDDDLSGLPPIKSVVITEDMSRSNALALMDQYKVNHLPVVDDQNRVLEVLARVDISKHILLSTPHMGDNELAFVEEAFKTNWIAPLGPNVDAFERDIAKIGGKDYASALSSGTAGIHLALLLLGVKTGDRVFCSTFTFAASANPIAYQGAEPVFIDSEPDSWNMSPQALERAFADARKEGWLPKAVIIVNLYGQSADYDPLLEICALYNVPVIEDAAESLGAKYKGKPSGSFGLMSIFSFNGNKIITTSGGGMLCSNDLKLIEKSRFLATQAREPALHYEHREIGYNYRMSNILAGVGRGQIQVLDDRIASRRGVSERYQDELSDIAGINWMPEPDWSFSIRWLSCCTVDENKLGISAHDLIRKLAEEMIETRPLWKPMHLQPVFEGCRSYAHDDNNISENLFATGLCLPSGSNMTDDELGRILETIRKILA